MNAKHKIERALRKISPQLEELADQLTILERDTQDACAKLSDDADSEDEREEMLDLLSAIKTAMTHLEDTQDAIDDVL